MISTQGVSLPLHSLGDWFSPMVYDGIPTKRMKEKAHTEATREYDLGEIADTG
jgi:hypothetical protein